MTRKNQDLTRPFKSLKDLRDYLNHLDEKTLKQPIIFGLVDDTLEDAWEIKGGRPLVNSDLGHALSEFDERLLKIGRIILYP